MKFKNLSSCENDSWKHFDGDLPKLGYPFNEHLAVAHMASLKVTEANSNGWLSLFIKVVYHLKWFK